MRLQNQQNKNIKVQAMRVNETRNDTIKEDDLQERENFTGKNEFLSWVGAHDCVKDKLTGYYAVQLMEINAEETKLTQPKLNHYKYMKQKLRSDDTNNGNDIFKDCQVEWDKEEDTEEKLTTSLSVPEHYKKYMVEEHKIIWQKPNRQQPIIGISYKGPKEKIDLVGPNDDAKPICIATDLEPM